MTYTFTIPVNPVGKGRPRFGKGRTYTPKRTVTYEQHVAAAALEAKLPKIQGPVCINVAFWCEPQRGGLSDLDNYLKALLDGLKDSFNDRQVEGIVANRYPAAKGCGKARVVISTEDTPIKTVSAEEWAQKPTPYHRRVGWNRKA